MFILGLYYSNINVMIEEIKLANLRSDDRDNIIESDNLNEIYLRTEA